MSVILIPAHGNGAGAQMEGIESAAKLKTMEENEMDAIQREMEDELLAEHLKVRFTCWDRWPFLLPKCEESIARHKSISVYETPVSQSVSDSGVTEEGFLNQALGRDGATVGGARGGGPAQGQGEAVLGAVVRAAVQGVHLGGRGQPGVHEHPHRAARHWCVGQLVLS